MKEVGDFAVLVVTFGRHKHSVLRLWSKELTDLGDRERDLLHGAVVADHLDLSGVFPVV